jgi:hypothetical protein
MMRLVKAICLIVIGGFVAGFDQVGADDRLKAAAVFLGHDFDYLPEAFDISFFERGGRMMRAVSKVSPSSVFTLSEPERCKFIFAWKPLTPDVYVSTVDFNKLHSLQVLPTASGLRRLIVLVGEAGAHTVQTSHEVKEDNKAQLDNLLPGEVPAYLMRLGVLLDKLCGVKLN